MAAIYSIACLYLGDSEELTYNTQVLGYLRQVVTSTTLPSQASLIIGLIRLLVQYVIVKRNRDQSWVIHLRSFSHLLSLVRDHEALNSSIRITYESIVKFVPNTDENGYQPNNGICLDYLLKFDDPEKIRDVGCSIQLLHLMGNINVYARKDASIEPRTVQDLLHHCNSITQNTPEQHKAKRDCILKTAESYKCLARVLIQWRLTNSDFAAAGNELAQSVLDIPTNEELLTAQFPLASAFWAIILSKDYGQKCYQVINNIWADRPTVRVSCLATKSANANCDQNTAHALTVARLARNRLEVEGFHRSTVQRVLNAVMKDEGVEELSLS